MRRQPWLLSSTGVLVLVALAWAQPSLTPEMVVDLKSVAAVSINPQGETIAYLLISPRSPEEQTGEAHTELFLVSANGGSSQQYTHRPKSIGSPRWSADGRWIYFTATRNEKDEKRAVYRIAKDGGEAVLITGTAEDIKDFQVSSDDKRIAFTMTDGKTVAEIEAENHGHDVKTVDKEFKYTRLHVKTIGSEQETIVSGEMTVWSFEWSPDDSQFLFQGSATPRTDDSYMFKQLYTVAHDGGEPTALTRTEGKLGTMNWSPDGKTIAFLGGVDNSDPTSGSIFIVPAMGGEARNLSVNYEGTVEWLTWIDAHSIAFVATERSHRVLKTITVTGAKAKSIIDGGYELDAISFAKDRKTFALRASTDEHPREVFVGSLGSGKLTRLTNSNPQLENVRISGSEEISWRAQDGLEITGLLMLPAGYEQGKRYPCIVQIHGGPESAYVDGWTTNYVRWGELLAANGFVVFSPNYRGSTGRGIAYSKADHKDLGGQEFQDVIDGLQYLSDQGFIDLERVGIGGFSYGGYFSALAATRYTEHFKAASMGAGIANWVSFTGTSDIPYENSMVHWNMSVWENMEKAWLASPLAHVNKSQTALLISHGEKDLRVPIGQGWEIYTAMKMLGKTVEFDIYPRELHGFAERNHQLFSIKRSLEWFEKHVKGDGKVTEMIP